MSGGAGCSRSRELPRCEARRVPLCTSWNLERPAKQAIPRAVAEGRCYGTFAGELLYAFLSACFPASCANALLIQLTLECRSSWTRVAVLQMQTLPVWHALVWSRCKNKMKWSMCGHASQHATHFPVNAWIYSYAMHARSCKACMHCNQINAAPVTPCSFLAAYYQAQMDIFFSRQHNVLIPEHLSFRM